MSQVIDRIMADMSMEEKVGQMLCLGFCGAYPHTDIVEAIDRYHPAGFRVSPTLRKFERYFGAEHPGSTRVVRAPTPHERAYGGRIGPPMVSARRYAEILNELRSRSMEKGAGVPLYYALDFEGSQNCDFYAPGVKLFPHPMGLAASGDTELCRRVAYTVGRQIGAIGINWLHSPVLDVNTEPLNPEIGTRSYSALADEVARFGAATLAGLNDARIIATGKHFPGRGHSSLDAHFDLAVIQESAERMHHLHLAPYKALIAAGLPAIMLAHSVFPGLDPDAEIATLSRAVVRDVLRGELGFDGVIMTDSFTMGGLVAKYEVVEAAVQCIRNGVDLILLKDANALRGEVFDGLLAAVRTGAIPEERLEEAARHVLAAKERVGLLDADGGLVNLDRVEEVLWNPENELVETEAADHAVVVLRDRDHLIPIPATARILVVEEVVPLYRRLNNEKAYPGALYHALLERGYDVWGTDFQTDESFEAIWPVIRERASQADIVVHSGFFERGGDIRKEYHTRFLDLGKPSVFVTNCPYETIVHPAMRTVVVTFSPATPSMQAAARVLTGERQATARLRFDPTRTY